MSTWTRRAVVALASMLLLAAPTTPALATASDAGLPGLPGLSSEIPVPEDDSFYAVPADVAAHRPGDVLEAREIDAKVMDLPVPATAWQVLYRTEDSRGRPSATVTTILLPDQAWTGPGARPVVSYQTAEDGVAGRCAPSYALRAGGSGGFTGSYSETGLMGLALARGWAVAAPDYEGPQSQFLVAGTQAKGVLDGIRAVRGFGPAGLRDSPVALWGYSGGSLASVTAAQLQAAYAPELDLAGVALGGLLGDVRATIDAFSGSIGGGAIPMGINGFLRAYPELRLLRYLTADGRAKVAETSADCIFDAAPRYPFLQLADIEATPDALSTPAVARMLRRNSPLHRAGHPLAPVYHYHTVLDEFAPIEPARATLARFCSAGTPVQSVEKLAGEHLSEIVLGAPGAVDFLATRFAGGPVVDTCATTAASARRAARPSIWYVDADAAGAGSGSRTRPFATLAAVEQRSRPGDTIRVLPAEIPLDGGIALQPGQRLIGLGAGARVTNTGDRLDGDAVRLADRTTVQGLRIEDPQRAGVYGLDVSGVRVLGNDISGHNASCTPGFLIPEFMAPTSVPGVGIPISGGLQNGWAGIMLDAQRRQGLSALVKGNEVHDAECGDGIDVRLFADSSMRARILDNDVHHLRQGPDFKSVLAIGVQASDTSRLRADIVGNTQSALGNDDDPNFIEGADSEGVFINGVGPSRLTARVIDNTYTNVDGLGGFSANGLEMVTMGVGSRVHTLVRDSSFSGSPGDVIEEGALGTDAVLTMVLDRVVAERSTGIGNTYVLPFNNGDCVLAGSLGARNSIALTVRDSVLRDCSNNGLSLGSNVVNGSGPTTRLSLDVVRTRITGNRGGNLGIRNFTDLDALEVRVSDSDLSGSSSMGSAVSDVAVEDLGSTASSVVDLGGGTLGSEGRNCLSGGLFAVDAVGYAVALQHAWWGQPGGPSPLQSAALPGAVDASAPLDAAPTHCS